MTSRHFGYNKVPQYSIEYLIITLHNYVHTSRDTAEVVQHEVSLLYLCTKILWAQMLFFQECPECGQKILKRKVRI
jgi:hypothetical protein